MVKNFMKIILKKKNNKYQKKMLKHLFLFYSDTEYLSIWD